MSARSKSCRAFCLLGSLGALASAPTIAQAAIIDSSQFFSQIPHQYVTFELDGAGNPLNLLQGQTRLMPAGEYSSIGLVFDPAVRWVNDSTPAFDVAQAFVATPVTAIPSSTANTFTMSFTVPVRSFGFAVINNMTFDPQGPRFEAYDAENQLIESVQFGGSLVDGSVVSPNLTAQYGYMGIFASRDIARVVVTKRAAILDDLRFSVLPSPGAGVLLAAALAGAAASRRRVVHC